MSARPLTVRLAAAIEDFGRSLDVRRVRRTRREALRRRAERLMASAIAGRDLAALREALAAEGLSDPQPAAIAASVLTLVRPDAEPAQRYGAWRALCRLLPEAARVAQAAPAGETPPALPHRKDIDG